jgi:hypothetical protein
MEAVEYLIYTLVFLVLIAFVGVIGYIIYDNYTYKNDLTTDLNTNFKGINKNFVSTTDVIGKVHVKHTSNLNALGETLINTSNLLDNKIDNVYTKNLASHDVIDKNIDDFGYNMNKYFKFNNADNATAGTNKKLFEYRTTTVDATAHLNLITQTTAVAGLKINSDATNSFQICNSLGNKCFQVLSTDDSLSIHKPAGMLGKSDIYIGGNSPSAPLAIVDGKTQIDGRKIEVRTDGKLYINDAVYPPPPPVDDVPVAPVPPQATATLTGIVNAITVSTPTGANYATAPTVVINNGDAPAGGTLATATAVLGTSGANPDKVTGITVNNGGSGYTTAPTITFTGGTPVASTAITDASAADVSVSITNIIASITINQGRNGSGYIKAPNVVINNGVAPSGGTLATATAVMGTNTNTDKVERITVNNPGSGYTSAPTITFTEAL